MKFTKKRLFALAVLPVAVFLLSGCGKQTATKSELTGANDAKNAAQTGGFDTPNPNLTNKEPAPIEDNLEPLPADNKQAIDQELSNIDKDLKSTDNTMNSTDLSNANLGI